MKLIRIIPFITTIIIMVMIFGFSSQDNAESSNLSEGVTQKLVDILPIIKNMSAGEKENVILHIHNTIRKCAHFTIYSALGFSAAAMFFSIDPKRRMVYIWIYAWAFSCVYSVTDEFHQLFVDGRGGRIRDVLLDTAGAMTGSGVFLWVRHVFFKIKDYFIL